LISLSSVDKPIHLLNNPIAVLCINMTCTMMTIFCGNFTAVVHVAHVQCA